MKVVSNGWTQQIRIGAEVRFVNNTHKAIKNFLNICNHSSTYTYFISEQHWGFWIGDNPDKPLLFILVSEDSISIEANRPIPPDESEVRLEIADPKFFDKLKEILQSHELVRTDE